MARKLTQPILSQWYHSLWLPTCALVYLIICLFDFIIMPVYTAYENSHFASVIISKLDEKDVASFATATSNSLSSNHQWSPLTLLGGGLFHLSFGSLLAAGAATRGLAKKSEVEGYYRSISGDNNSESMPPPPKI